MTVKEAADRLGLSIRGVQQRITRGTLPATKNGRDWNIHPNAVMKALKQPSGNK